MEQTSIDITKVTRKLLAGYELDRDLKNYSEAITDAVSKAIKYEESLKESN